MSLHTAETSKPSDLPSGRSSSRQRTVTEKMQEVNDQNAIKHKRAFYKAYDAWKQTAKESRATMKCFCSMDDLDNIEQNIQTKREGLLHQYEHILRNQTNTPEIVGKMDTCAILTDETLALVNKRRDAMDEDYNERVEKERVRIVLNKKEYGSVFGDTKTDTVVSQHTDCSSVSSSSSSKRQDAEAELAAKREQAKAMKDIHARQSHINKLENEWKLEEKKIVADLERKREERRLKLEEERTKLTQLKAKKVGPDSSCSSESVRQPWK